MKKWRATMPRENPEQGTALVVVSIKTNGGFRMEFSGQMAAEDAADIWLKVPPFDGVKKAPNAALCGPREAD
jgi:hypothetical protein